MTQDEDAETAGDGGPRERRLVALTSPPRRHRWLLFAALALSSVPASMASVFVVVYLFIVPSRDNAIPLFVAFGTNLGKSVPEEAFMDPLIVARGDIVPDVSAAILKRLMPKRRYAIGFLGQRGDARALPSLLKILEDPTEDALFRGDALDAISLIDGSRGRRLARAYLASPDYLGSRAKSIHAGKEAVSRRSYGEALQSYLRVVLFDG